MHKAPAILLALLCAGCGTTVGDDFPRPDAAKLHLGGTTEADLVALEGQPTTVILTTLGYHTTPPSHFDWAAAGAPFTVLRYRFNLDVVGGEHGARAAVFVLTGGRLQGWTYASDLPSDATDFNLGAARAALAPGTPRAALTALLGEPDGRAVYPLVQLPGQHEERWEYYHNGNGLRTSKRLTVLFDADDRVLEHQELASELPITTRPAPVIVAPVVLPRR